MVYSCAAMDGRARSLKERTIGIDVFERPVGYDPSTGHVVRGAACEMPKRLAGKGIEWI